MSINSKARVLNLNSSFSDVLTAIVEQSDVVKAQRELYDFSSAVWCGFDEQRWVFSGTSLGMLKNIVITFDTWLKRGGLPEELIDMQERFRLRQEREAAALRAAGEPEEKWKYLSKSVDLRGVVWRHFLKLLNHACGLDIISFHLSVGRACAVAHRETDFSDEKLYIIGSFLTTLVMHGGKEWFQFRLEKESKDSLKTYIEPTDKTLECFQDCHYFDLSELPLLIPIDDMPVDLKARFEEVLDRKNGRNTYLHTTAPRTNVVEDVLKHFSSIGFKINKKLFDWLMENDDVLLSYKKGRDRLTRISNADFFTQRSILGLARTFLNVNRFYFPVFYDWRSRLYATPTYLNYQGNKLALSLLMFSSGKKINVSGLRYLILYGSNLYGKKVSYDEAVGWLTEHLDKITRLDKDFIMGAKEPFLFAAFCLEYRDYLKSPGDFVSHLPVLIDCTCSGLQHLAAITRDCSLAHDVNLTWTEKPNDIYSRMALLLENTLCQHPELHGLLVDRSFVKRPIMTISYSATIDGLTAQLLTFFTYNFKEKVFIKNDQTSFKISKKALKKLASLILNLFYKEHPKLKVVLDYLQNVARCMADLDLPVVWNTPAGVEITQKYNERTVVKVKSSAYAWFKPVALPLGTDKIDKRKQTLGIMPNMVHSLDASNIYGLLKHLDSGVPILTIHDCFGGLAADMDLIELTVKKAFVSLYCNENWLNLFHKSNRSLIEAHYTVNDEGFVLTNCGKKVRLPEVPELGDFNVNEALNAPFMLR